MESVLGRYRNLIILAGVLFLQVLGLAVQVKRGGNDTEHTRLIRFWAVGALTPFERGLVWVENSSANLWHNYFYLRGLRAENRQLKEQIEQMRLEQVRLSQDAAQAHRLQALLSFKEQFVAKTVAAQVIGSSGSDLSRVIYIDKGENEGLKRDMAVITADGIVGKVLLVYPSVSQVLLISDQSSGVGVILERTRLQGVLRGTATGEVTLERVMSDEQVSPGDTVLTSGGDQIFPKGLPVGRVTKVGTGKDLFLNIQVKPAANLSKLEEVLVLVEKRQQQTVETTGLTRAADILAARLPSVPDKPAPTPGATTGGSGESSQAGSGSSASSKPASTPATPPTIKNSAAPGNTPVVPGAEKPTDPASAVPKTASASSGAGTQTKPVTSPGKPAATQPTQANPSTPPPNPKTPAGQDSPD